MRLLPRCNRTKPGGTQGSGTEVHRRLLVLRMPQARCLLKRHGYRSHSENHLHALASKGARALGGKSKLVVHLLSFLL